MLAGCQQTQVYIENLYEIDRDFFRAAKLSDFILNLIVFSSTSSLRSQVAENLNTPAFCLEKLVDDRDNNVRIEVARKPNTPIKNSYSIARLKLNQ